MTLIFVRIKPLKLGNRELAKYWDRLYNQSKIQYGHTHLTKNTEKAAYIKKYHPTIELRIQEEKFRSLCDRAQLDTNDFTLITTGVNRDLTLLEEELERGIENRTNPLPQKAKVVSPHKDIKEQVAEIASLSKEQFNQKSSTAEFESILDMSMAVEVDPDTMELKSQDTGSQTEPLPETKSSEQQTVTSSVMTVESQTENIDEKNTSMASNMDIDDPPNHSVKCYQVNAEMKLDTGSSIPIWKKSTNDLDGTKELRQYIRDLLRFKKLKLLENDAVLINASLVKSGRTDVYAELPKDAEEDVEKFTKYLRTAYGLSGVEMLKELQSIKQESGESPHTFLSRVVNLYYEARNAAKKTLEDIKSNPVETNEIIRLFLTGLRDPRVRIAVRSRLDDLDLTKIAKATRNASMALRENNSESNSMSVNHIGNNGSETTDLETTVEKTTCDELNVLNINAHQHCCRHQKTDRRNIECFKCRKMGHYARDCRSGREYNNETGQGYSKTSYGQMGTKTTAKFSCFNCGKQGHYGRDCWHKRTNKQN